MKGVLVWSVILLVLTACGGGGGSSSPPPPPPTPPTANGATASLAEDASVTATLSGAAGEGGNLTFTVQTQPQNGTVSLNGSEFTYTPAADFSGSDSFTFIVTESGRNSAPATVELTVTAVNDAPSAEDGSGVTDPGEALSATLTGSDVESDPLLFTVVTPPTSGAVMLDSGGAGPFTYTPNPGFSGADSFTFVANDGTDDSALANFTIVVDSTPTVNGSLLSVSDIGPVMATIDANDAENDPLTFAIVSEPAKGTINNFDVQSGSFEYQPNPGEDGTDSFVVTASDPRQTSAPATIDVEIFAWQIARLGTAAEERGGTQTLLLDAQQNLIYAGYTEGQLGSTLPAGERDAFVAKFDRRGGNLWTTQFGDAGNNFIVYTVKNPNADEYFAIQSDRDPNGARVVAYNNSGTILWDVSVDLSAFNIITAAYRGGIDQAGDLYVISWDVAATSSGGTGSVLTKLRGSDGAVLWHRHLESSSQNPGAPFLPDSAGVRLRSVKVDNSGNLVTVGSLFSSGGRPCMVCNFIARFDIDGNLLANTEITDFGGACSTPIEATIYRVTVNPDDSLIAMGFNVSAAPGGNGVISKLSADGSQSEWTRCDDSGANTTYSFADARLTANNDILLVTSEMVGSVTSGPDSSTGKATRFDQAGNMLFSTLIEFQTEAGAAAITYAEDVVENADGEIFVAIATDGVVDERAGAGELDVYILRLDSEGMLR